MDLSESLYSRRVFTVALTILLALLLLGFGQLQLFNYQKRLAGECDRLLFRFNSVREYIIAALLERRYPDLQAAISELEDVNQGVTAILQNPVIPDQFKVSFMNRVDLAAISLRLRQTAAGDQRSERVLQDDLRVFSDGLLLFHKMLSEHVKKKLVGYQTLIIGVLVLALLLLGNGLFYYQRRYLTPISRLERQLATGGPLVLAANERWLSELLDQVVARSPEPFLSATPLAAMVFDDQGRLLAENEEASRLLVSAPDTTRQVLFAGDDEVEVAGRTYRVIRGRTATGGVTVQLCPREEGPAAVRFAARTLLGSLTLGLCHEVGQACNIIMNVCQLAEEEAPPALLQEINRENERIAAVVRLLCSLGAERQTPPARYSLDRLVEETVRLMAMVAVGSGRLAVEGGAELGQGYGRPLAVKLVLLVLFVHLFGHRGAGVTLACRQSGDAVTMELSGPYRLAEERSMDEIVALGRQLLVQDGIDLQVHRDGDRLVARLRWPPAGHNACPLV